MATSLTQLSRANLEPHSIIATTEKPIKLKLYKLSKEHSDILKQEIISLLNKGLIFCPVTLGISCSTCKEEKW